MSRPAMAAWLKCQISVLSLRGSVENPSAYSCTIAASSTRSSRYFFGSGVALVHVAAGGGGVAFEQAVARASSAPARSRLGMITGSGTGVFSTDHSRWGTEVGAPFGATSVPHL